MAKTNKDQKLTDKQARFVDEYLIDLNATQAAIRAGYSEKTASQQAYQLLQKTLVSEALVKRRADVAESNDITPERILKEYARIGFSDLRNTMTPAGQLKNPNDWDDDTAAAIASVEVVTKRTHVGEGEDPELEYTHKIKTWDKPKALDAMAKHLGMFDGKAGPEDEPDSLEAMNLRALGRKLVHVLNGATEARDESAG